jgi:hypothetical protein
MKNTLLLIFADDLGGFSNWDHVFHCHPPHMSLDRRTPCEVMSHLMKSRTNILQGVELSNNRLQLNRQKIVMSLILVFEHTLPSFVLDDKYLPAQNPPLSCASSSFQIRAPVYSCGI